MNQGKRANSLYNTYLGDNVPSFYVSHLFSVLQLKLNYTIFILQL